MNSRDKFSRQTLIRFFHSIRFRLVLWFVLILAAVMGIFSGFIYWRQAQDIRSIAVQRLNIQLKSLLGVTGEEDHALGGQQEFPSEIYGHILNLNTTLLEGDILAVQAADGTILVSNGILTAEQIQQLNLPRMGWKGIIEVTIPKILKVENDQYLFINPEILQNEQVNGYLLVGVPLDANNQLMRLSISLIIGNLLTLAIALTGGFWLADRAMRPVHTITQAARQISETDLHKRLNLPGQDELSELAKTFDDMLDRLQTAFERQRQFTADASHELRTPLTIIDLESSRGLSAQRSINDYKKILYNIQAENQFMIRLVNNLLALARMDAGQEKISMEILDLSDVAMEVIERLESIAVLQGVALEVGELPENLILGDRSALIQMLNNLVENAIKYSATVAVPVVRILAGRREESGHQIAWVRVSDNGIGILAENLVHIFDRFYQVDTARKRADNLEVVSDGQASSGTGLGLAIAQWIAQAHHGEIRVESTVGKGSTFEVVLPAYNHNV